MKTISVEVRKDHIESLTRIKRPILAIAELIWNGFDADANTVVVRFAENGLGQIEEISVTDDGHGLEINEAENAFKSLGGSWKRGRKSTKNGRLLHGRHGKGRFRAFNLGKTVEWDTTYRSDGENLSYAITGEAETLGTFVIGDEREGDRRSGTKVRISNIRKAFRSLRGSDAKREITEQFALYMTQYSNVKINYDGEFIEPSDVIYGQDDYRLEGLSFGDAEDCVDASLTIIEWTHKTGDRKLFLCDKGGFTYHEMAPGIQAPGFVFTSYVKSDHIRRWEEDGLLAFEEGHPDLQKLLMAAKKVMKDHFRRRKAESARHIVQQWKEEDIYPYEGEPSDVIEATERQVFDICALNLNDFLPEFPELPQKNKRLSLRLLKHVLETSPTTVRRIFAEVLELTEEKLQEFAELIERASLEAIIGASRDIANRLDFLRGLEVLVFDPESKKVLLERKQLHRIIADRTWIFGERFNLSVDDQSLTEVLRKHLGQRSDMLIDEPVLRDDGREGVVDLMLSRNIPQADSARREHLIIELKRPKVKIDMKAMDQVMSYAEAIASDERFRDTDTRWTFWAVSNEMAGRVRTLTEQKGRAKGIFSETETYSIWVRSWGEILHDCRGRLHFFQDKLKYKATRDAGIKHIRMTHEKYIPECIQACE